MERLTGLIRADKEFSSFLTTLKTAYREKESLPVILFLHGAGERGSNIEDVKVHGIPKYFSKDPDYKGLRVITLSPQCPNGMVWNQLPYPLMTWIRAALKEVGGDTLIVEVNGFVEVFVLTAGGYGQQQHTTQDQGKDSFHMVHPLR